MKFVRIFSSHNLNHPFSIFKKDKLGCYICIHIVCVCVWVFMCLHSSEKNSSKKNEKKNGIYKKKRDFFTWKTPKINPLPLFQTCSSCSIFFHLNIEKVWKQKKKTGQQMLLRIVLYEYLIRYLYSSMFYNTSCTLNKQ